jgi:hypothetical protein
MVEPSSSAAEYAFHQWEGNHQDVEEDEEDEEDEDDDHDDDDFLLFLSATLVF